MRTEWGDVKKKVNWSQKITACTRVESMIEASRDQIETVSRPRSKDIEAAEPENPSVNEGQDHDEIKSRPD